MRGWITQPARSLEEFLNSIFTIQLFEHNNDPGIDFATLNIQRGWDHGLPPYLVWKHFCQKQFNITSNIRSELTQNRLVQIYGSLDILLICLLVLLQRNRFLDP